MKCTNLNMQWKCIKNKPEPKPEPTPKCGVSAGDDCLKSNCCDGNLECGSDNKCS
jgi:hypothetical protein